MSSDIEANWPLVNPIMYSQNVLLFRLTT